MSASDVDFTLARADVVPLRASQSTTLAVAASGTLLVTLVFSAVVSTVGASIHTLGGGLAGETWTLSAMSLGMAVALLVAGELADAAGRVRTLSLSAVALAATSALGAVAGSTAVLVAARVLQGVAGAGIVAASLGLIGHTFPAGRERTHATAVWGAAVGGGIALGPLAGAWLMNTLGWRSSFWLEALLAAALVVAARWLPESRAQRPRRLDVPGAITLAAGVAALTAGLVAGRHNWSSAAAIILLAGGVLLLVAFGLIELARRQPLLDLHLFGEPTFVASITGALFTGVAVIGLMSYSVPVMQTAFRSSVATSAAVLASWSATSMLVALAARRLPAALASHQRLAIGLALAAAGELGLALPSAGAGAATLIPGFGIAGIGSGLANAALGRLAVESVPRDRAAMGSGANNTARYFGGAAGVALVVALASSSGPLHPVAGFHRAALVSAGLCLVGAVIAARCRRTSTNNRKGTHVQ
jgi:MFS family permease